MNKFLHLICGTTFLGIIIATFFYIARNIQKNDRALIDYTLKASYFGDALIFLIIIAQLFTAVKLVSAGYFTLQVPWIAVAFYAFGTVILLWLSLLLIKYLLLAKPIILPSTLKLFYLLNILIVLIFSLIIHDAVTQSTWFEIFLRT